MELKLVRPTPLSSKLLGFSIGEPYIQIPISYILTTLINDTQTGCICGTLSSKNAKKVNEKVVPLLKKILIVYNGIRLKV